MLTRSALVLGLALGLLAPPAMAQDAGPLDQAPPPAPYAKVSELVKLPDFLPGLGTLYVNPETLPAGPFLGYDHDGKLAATVFMTPIQDLQDGTAYDDLAVGAPAVSSVDIYYNAGHPGVEKPHIHVVLYHGADAKAKLAE
ncbi:MAG TPA: hypothetical protein PLL33_14585 [Paracoccus sp. (in: a-proteobacteria)]|nr:hypothetical protein [Paracoccus sp. (in: a-proteobacteria)]